MAVIFNQTTFDSAQSSTGAYLLGNFTGINTLSGAAPVTINGTIDAPGTSVTATLNLLNVGTVQTTADYLGYSTAPNNEYVYYFSAQVVGIATPVTFAVTGAPTGLPTLSSTPVISTAVTAPVGPSTPCYATGTHIRTVRGEIAVEDLAIGDEVVTASGATRPVIWLGHRVTDCASHPKAEIVQPIRITAGAIAPNMPSRDLRISPDHAIFLDDVLVQARFLVNGTTIVREAVTSVTYWHVELESHDVLIAENLPAESYLDVGNRHSFINAGDVVSLRPEFAVEDTDGHCAPLVTGGERLRAIRSWLAERARHLGARTTTDAAIHLLADGIALTPIAVEGNRFVYAVPADTAALTLASRSAVPAEVMVDTADDRRLGVRLTALDIDGESILPDDARLSDGWHAAEVGWRWSDGAGTLPVGRQVTFTAHTLPIYPATAIVQTDAQTVRQPLRMVG